MVIIYFSLALLGFLSELISITSLIKYGQLRLPEIWRPLLLLLSSGFLSDLISFTIIIFLSGVNNYIILYAYCLIEIMSCFLIFYKLSRNMKEKMVLYFVGFIQISVFAVELLFSRGDSNNFYSNVLNKLVFIIFSIMYAYKEYRSIVSINYSLITFIVLLVLCFYSLSIFYYSLFEEVIKLEPSVYNVLWPIPMVSTILFNSIIGWALWRREN